MENYGELKNCYATDFSLPTKNQQIVQVLGVDLFHSNFLPVQSANGFIFRVQKPRSHCNIVRIFLGDYVLIENNTVSGYNTGDIIRVLTDAHIRHFALCSVWPIFTFKYSMRRYNINSMNLLEYNYNNQY